MSKIIPIGPSLVVLIGPSGAGKSHFCDEHFDARDVVSSDALRVEFTGDLRRQDKNDLVFREFHRRIEVKVNAGQRVIADATNLRNRDRRAVAEIGKMMNVPVTYVVINRSPESKFSTGGWRNDVWTKGRPLMEAMEETFKANEKVILDGDNGLADVVIDTRIDKYEVIPALQRTHVARQLLDRGFEFIRVVGDVHGNIDGLWKALSGVDDRGVTFTLFLGDVVDYGVHTLRTAELVHEVVSRGEAGMVRGNHERKILNWVRQVRTKEGFRGRLSHGNDVTTNQLLAMDPKERVIWEQKFRALVEMSPDWIQIGQTILTHGAVHHRMWGNTLFRSPPNSALESYCLFGETTGKTDPDTGFPIRKYDWVNEIESRNEAIVGHAILDREAPVGLRGSKGGSAIFLDTGSGKDGKLSWIDFEIVDSKRTGPRLQFVSAQDEFGKILDDLLIYSPAPIT